MFIVLITFIAQQSFCLYFEFTVAKLLGSNINVSTLVGSVVWKWSGLTKFAWSDPCWNLAGVGTKKTNIFMLTKSTPTKRSKLRILLKVKTFSGNIDNILLFEIRFINFDYISYPTFTDYMLSMVCFPLQKKPGCWIGFYQDSSVTHLVHFKGLVKMCFSPRWHIS